jgi:RNA polymerase sigma-70 factor (ECF subfamily)
MAEERRVQELVEHLFRHQAGQMLAMLTHIFGLENLDLAEEVVQEALLGALQQWRFHGIPDNPRAWLVRAARNKALDVLRRQAVLRSKEHELEQRLRERQERQAAADPPEACDLHDEQLAMIFLCCNPALPSEARVALTLKAVSGFSVAEIARAFLCEEPTIAQRLVRAKRRIREAEITLGLPSPPEIASRLDSVLQVLYLLFNEGYAAHAGENLVREDLCPRYMRCWPFSAFRRHASGPEWTPKAISFCWPSSNEANGIKRCWLRASSISNKPLAETRSANIISKPVLPPSMPPAPALPTPIGAGW